MVNTKDRKIVFILKLLDAHLNIWSRNMGMNNSSDQFFKTYKRQNQDKEKRGKKKLGRI
jgi:hypothetical protein